LRLSQVCIPDITLGKELHLQYRPRVAMLLRDRCEQIRGIADLLPLDGPIGDWPVLIGHFDS
jgi:hypothetical protein